MWSWAMSRLWNLARSYPSMESFYKEPTSCATGESDYIRTIPYEVVQERERKGVRHPKGVCFLTSGSKVQEGVGSYVVIAVGPRSFNGKLLIGKRSDLNTKTVIDGVY